MMAKMRDNRDGYGDGEYAGWQQKRCGKTDMEKWVGITAMDWENIDREQLLT